MNKLVTASLLSMASGLAMAQGTCCDDAQKGADCKQEERVVSDATAHLPALVRHVVNLTGQPEVKTHMVMIQQDGDHEYKVEVTDGEIKAWADGKAVPKKRLKVGDDKIRILGDDGETVAEFHYQKAGPEDGRSGEVFKFKGDSDGPIIWESEDGEIREAPGAEQHKMMLFGQPEGDHPPVMIGINMNPLNTDEADDRVLEYLDDKGIDPENVIVVLSVVDDLPGDQAGLRDGDVIVRVDGEWGVNADRLREILGEKEPGDTVEIGALRKGKFREFEIELAEWDAQKLGAPAGALPGIESPMVFQWRGEDGEDLAKQLKERLGDLGENNKELELQLKALVEGLKQDGATKQWQFDVMPRIQRFGPGGEGAERFLVQPAPRAEAMSGFEERLSRIEDRLKSLESRLDRILEALEHNEN